MKKILLVLSILLLSGCYKSTPTKEVEKYFNKYQNNNEEIINKIDDIIDFTNYSEEKKSEFINIIKNNYSNLVFNVKNEEINANKSIVTVEIEVYDFYKVLNETLNYRNNYMDEFMIDGYYNENLFINYRLKKLKDVNERIKYTLELSLTKIDGKWYLDELSREYKEKINGIYNY